MGPRRVRHRTSPGVAMGRWQSKGALMSTSRAEHGAERTSMADSSGCELEASHAPTGGTGEHGRVQTAGMCVAACHSSVSVGTYLCHRQCASPTYAPYFSP